MDCKSMYESFHLLRAYFQLKIFLKVALGLGRV